MSQIGKLLLLMVSEIIYPVCLYKRQRQAYRILPNGKLLLYMVSEIIYLVCLCASLVISLIMTNG